MIKTLALLLWITATQVGSADTPRVAVENVRKVFDDGDHNAFTDLIEFQNAYYLTFRTCPDGHGVSPNASVIIMRTTDFAQWSQVAKFRVAKRDTRDPHFLVFRDRLFVYTGTWYAGNAPVKNSGDLEMNQHLGYAVWSDDGNQWTKPIMLEGTFGHYIWRAASHQGKAYLCGRRKVGFEVGPKGEPNEIESLMLESDDGLIWRMGATFQETEGNETAFRFDQQGDVLAIGRRRGTAQILRSSPPYTTWQRSELDRHVGGPLLAKWGDRMVVGGRRPTERGPKTSMCWLVGNQLHEFAELPSGGDNSYPGFVSLSPTQSVMSWYSTHEGKTSIYMADLEIKP